MKSLDPLKMILNEQVVCCRALLDLLQRERLCLLEVDAYTIENLSTEKDTIVMKLRLLEEERQRLAADWTGGDATLKGLSAVTGDTSLLGIRSKLISLVQAIEEMNSFNRLLIERSLDYMKSNALFFSEDAGDGSRAGKGMRVSVET
ncbi:MAG: flagellar protein FlgN [Nitrospiraceae bacterium]|nr:flagellar protein FlgN [Nitrospiraceae bacterium]